MQAELPKPGIAAARRPDRSPDIGAGTAGPLAHGPPRDAARLCREHAEPGATVYIDEHRNYTGLSRDFDQEAAKPLRWRVC